MSSIPHSSSIPSKVYFLMFMSVLFVMFWGVATYQLTTIPQNISANDSISLFIVANAFGAQLLRAGALVCFAMTSLLSALLWTKSSLLVVVIAVIAVAAGFMVHGLALGVWALVCWYLANKAQARQPPTKPEGLANQ